MGYINTFLANAEALKEAHQSGADAVLIVDIPGENNLKDLGIKNQNLQDIGSMA